MTSRCETVGEDAFMVNDSGALEGHVECLDCGSIWCEHLANVTKEYADSVFIWPENAEPVYNQVCQVPMMPTKGLWAKCELAYDPKVKAFAVTFAPEDKPSTYFIGFIHNGEGRAIVRSMLVDWFNGNIRPQIRVTGCGHASHSFASQMRFENDVKKGGGNEFAQRWAIFAEGRCLGCIGGGDSNFDDVVPDEDKKASPWK